MKFILIYLLISTSLVGCTIYSDEINRANAICAEHGGISRIKNALFLVTICNDGTAK